MTILNKYFGGNDEPKGEDEPQIEINKTYRLCVEDNPDERKYRCGKKDVMSPACSMSLHLDGLTTKETRDIEIEIRNMLERNDFTVR